ncbi:hypothetical protein KQX54_016091 [Cotesia glomerata]|uniref:Uncharacterized protein n=1 Tax=Cotesia glomerata TaxID=32391 RepID=A0AAV7ISG5_COTGL|nr:hypothetical protein KQX54_016091 [Cotesia glomerata]
MQRVEEKSKKGPGSLVGDSNSGGRELSADRKDKSLLSIPISIPIPCTGSFVLYLSRGSILQSQVSTQVLEECGRFVSVAYSYPVSIPSEYLIFMRKELESEQTVKLLAGLLRVEVLYLSPDRGKRVYIPDALSRLIHRRYLVLYVLVLISRASNSGPAPNRRDFMLSSGTNPCLSLDS